MKYIMTGSPFKYFSLMEIANNDTVGEIQLNWTPEVTEHGHMMDELRDWYGKPLNVSSWFRGPKFNKAHGGASNSCHLDGRATDVNNIDTTNNELVKQFITAWQVICANHNKIGGIEIYPKGKNFVNGGMHFDSHSDKFGCTEFRIHDNR